MLQPEELFRGFLDERLDGILIAQPVASGNGVVGMLVEAVVRGDDTRRAPLGRDGVAAHRVDLGNNRDAEMGMGLGDRQGRRANQLRRHLRAPRHGKASCRTHYSAENSSSTITWPSCRMTFRLTVPS